ncbi:MAG: hypothetical protein LBJ00_01365 [Planctomycetaceae bacterium]|nr:hypothetical protein [Planctomycetaceae bacterium]
MLEQTVLAQGAFQGLSKTEFSGISEKTSTQDRDFEVLGGRVDTLDKKVDVLDKKVDTLDKKVDALDEKVDALDEKVDTLDKKVDKNFEETDKKFVAIDERFDGIDKRLDGIDVRLDGIDVRLDRMDVRLDGIDVRLDRMDGRFDGIDVSLVSINASIASFESRMGTIGNSIGAITEKSVAIIADKLVAACGHMLSEGWAVERNRRIYDADNYPRAEIDVLIKDQGNYWAVEVKSTATSGDVARHAERIQRLLKELKATDREFKQLVGIVVGWKINKAAIAQAIEEGFYIFELDPEEDNLIIVSKSPDNFKPKKFTL